MPLRNRGPICGESNPVCLNTPGTTGVKDAADPDYPIEIRYGRGPRGAIQMAEEGEIVLAQAGKGLPLPAKKSVTRQVEVVLTATGRGWYQWASQFVAHSRSRAKLSFGYKKGSKYILMAYRNAAKRAGKGGRLIISAGHGYSRGLSSGAVDLAPGDQMMLASKHFDILHNPRLVLTKNDQKIMKTFKDIGNILRTHKVKDVIFLTCNVGKSQDFLQDIADEWKVKVGGYTSLLETEYNKGGKIKSVIFLNGKKPTSAAGLRRAAHEYPVMAFSDFWWVPPSTKAKKKSAKP